MLFILQTSPPPPSPFRNSCFKQCLLIDGHTGAFFLQCGGCLPNLFDTYWVCPFLKRDNVNLLDRPCALPRACKRLTAVVKNDWDLKRLTFSKLSLDIPPFSCSSVGVLWSKPQWGCLALSLAFTFLTEPVTSQHSSPGLQASWSCHGILSGYHMKASQSSVSGCLNIARRTTGHLSSE